MLRKYQKNDIPTLVCLEHDYLGTSLEEEYYLVDLNNPLAYHCVWEEEGTIVGFVSSIFDGFSLEILNIVVDKDKQSRGYGTKILTTLFDQLVPLGLNHVTLEVRQSNLGAIHLYEKIGFQPIHIRKEYYSNKENAIVMQKLYDDKVDIIHLEAILFSKKKGRKYTSEFKERYCLNYYDLFDYKIDSLKDYQWEDYILFLANWTDENLFQGFDIAKVGLMHTNAYHYHSLSKKDYIVLENDLEGYLDYSYQSNLLYGDNYARKYALFSLEKIQEGKMRFFSVRIDNEIIGTAITFEYYHSIFISGLFVKEKYQNQGIASAIMDACVCYAKQIGKYEIYLEVDLEETSIEIYKRMNFSTIETYYEMLKVR
ncbi:MAG: ribosomal protein S18-alanine N-acetyltransferase [Anaeroplasmataceae bacterium]|nr:ribosomal protein S18-alanine N-acetyltransferase [Anaeroplasmataceae bacterium]